MLIMLIMRWHYWTLDCLNQDKRPINGMHLYDSLTGQKTYDGYIQTLSGIHLLPKFKF